ncbi:ribbon-helix-helix domain-containing protein [Mycobacterium avium]|uniref:ribbon-helix-helix domain-containing protein n=1 Tax=Mycobacterium avium TaxID=1764 RepID=UPI000A042B76|nr:ribbon-helix-helix domain-containing protein [Mycobacterium avium]
MAGKGVFSDQLDDIDEIMPPPIPKPDEQESADAGPPPSDPAEELAVAHAVPNPQSPQSGPVTAAARPRRRRAASTVPTAEVAPQIHRLLRRLTTRERSRDPITARTYAQVVLDAIEAHQSELATCWQPEAAAAQGGGGLFSRRPAAPARRRRHAEPPARVPLTGLNAADAEVLDQLVARWNAPSRSALVEQALRLYLNAD